MSERMLVVDGHLDLAFNALFHRRDLTQSVQTLREREDPPLPRDQAHPDSLRERRGVEAKGKGVATVALPQMRAGCVGIALATIMSRVQQPTAMMNDGCRTQMATYGIGQSHLNYYLALFQSIDTTGHR